jgi:hypothetical protein
MWLFMPMFFSKIKFEININKRGVGGGEIVLTLEAC